MKPIKIVERKTWLNIQDCREVSLTGAVPWHNEHDRLDWVPRTAGYSIIFADENGRRTTRQFGKYPMDTMDNARKAFAAAQEFYGY